jgi:tetratricopeptide (TPR) repeat protein
MGVKTTRANLLAVLAEAAHAQGRDDEALEWSEVSERVTAPGDLYPQVRWRSARAKALARLDRFDEAERLAREAVALAEQTDFLDVHGDAQMALAQVLQATGRRSEAAEAIGGALELYERKQNLVSAERARRAAR